MKQWINRQSKNIYPAVHQVLASWKREFPDRSDALGLDDVIPYIGVLPDWASLMKFYDIIIGYSTDPLYPMLINKPYFAFEHGTIRDIPYTKSSIGRLCSMSYRKAEHVFVTNFDCVESAKNLAHERFSVINHPYDEDHGLSLSDISVARKSLLGELDSTFLVFHPTRHDWIPHTGYADKANDILIRAFIDLRRRGFKLGLVCCEWGSNVKDSKTLLRDFDLDKFVKWLPPLPITPFEQMCRTTDLVADQFKLGAFGGVCFKAMAVGAPILTYLNETLLLRQYPEVPPVINCSTTEGISSRLEEYMSRPYKLQSIGSASRQWMKNYHGKSATVNTQIDQFRRASPEGFAR